MHILNNNNAKIKSITFLQATLSFFSVFVHCLTTVSEFEALQSRFMLQSSNFKFESLIEKFMLTMAPSFFLSNFFHQNLRHD